MAGNTSNTSNGTSNTSNGTSNAGVSGDFGGGWLLPDRVDFPFISDSYTDPSAANPPIRLDTLTTARGPQQYQDHEWAAKWNAWRLLYEFMTVPGAAGAPGGISVDAIAAVEGKWSNAQGTATTEAELLALSRAARDERPEALGEILSQDAEFITEFMAVLSMAPGSHPKTYRLLHAANLIGQYAVHYFKGIHATTRNRPRPSHMLPALAPPIPLPGHAAYPSGHATQANLMAEAIARMLAPATEVARNAYVLARRIGRNREIAGLHYPSDSEGGRVLAEQLIETLTGGGCPNFEALLGQARGEWP